eukprot:Nitzschia sp. Nitz4//scaffold2_size372955//304242//304970//NITZ4_HMGL//1//CDS//3329546973//5862//frame0
MNRVISSSLLSNKLRLPSVSATRSFASATERQVKIVEVGPRDGLQNEKGVIQTSEKVELIHRLAKAGCTYIESGAFVSPKWVPQMADSVEVLQQLTFPDTPVRPTVACLVPNVKGLESCANTFLVNSTDASQPLQPAVDEIAIFGSASEAFSQKNIACSIDESMERFKDVVVQAREFGYSVRGYVSAVVACPYDGPIKPTQVAYVVEQMLELGCYEISLGDTIGVGTPGTVNAMLREVLVSTR